MAPTKKDGEESSACLQWGGDQRTHHWCLQACTLGTQRTWKFAVKKMEKPDVHMDTRLNKAAWTKGTGMSYTVIHVWLSRKESEDEDWPNELCMWAAYLPVITFKNLQSLWIRTNHWLLNKVTKLHMKMIEEIQVPDDIVELLCLSIWVNNMWVFFYMLLNLTQTNIHFFWGRETGWLEDKRKRGIFHCIFF